MESNKDDSNQLGSLSEKNDDGSEIGVRMEQLIIGKRKSKTDVSFPTPNVFSKNDFEVVELLGKGAYAKVVKAVYTLTKEVKAIKIIDKTFVEREHKLYQVYLENQILQMIDHPNIISIEGIFEESEKIFMVIDYLPNGDFFEFLKNNAPLKYETAQFYAGQLVKALEYLHQKGISHRDLKPENIMLDKSCYLKLIDFATCKIAGKVFDKTTMTFVNEDEINLSKSISDMDSDEECYNKSAKNTFVGTAEYVSPEVLVDQSAGPAADLWALGCIIYQMFTGNSPFRDKTEYLVFKKILELNYAIPEDVPEDAKNLIQSLLITDPCKRLGASPIDDEENNYKALRSHPFFSKLDFETLNKIEPPNRNLFKIMVTKNIVQKDKNKSSELIDPILRHKNTILVIKQDVIEKKSPWFHYNTRRVVLDNTPKIEYIDPGKNIVKGVIYLTKACYAKFVDNNIFELYTPKRTFKFKTATYESGVWSKIINETIEKYAKN